MALMTASALSKSFGENIILNNLSFEIGENDKIGLVGVNGAGKTTLMKILMGELSPDSGTLTRSSRTEMAAVDQFGCKNLEVTAWEEVQSIFEPIMQIERELERIALRIETAGGDADRLVRRQHDLMESFEALGGHYYKSRVRSALLGLGFSEADFELVVGHLSGGQRSKLQLAKLLLSKANFLILDEPTNHLDIPSIEWLEDYLKQRQGALMVISHDRFFLDKICSQTFEIENGGLTVAAGNYSFFLEKKAADREIAARHFVNTSREIKRIEGIVAQQRQWNRERNIKTAESKLKQIARLERDLEKPDSLPDKLGFDFSKDLPHSPNEMLVLENLSFGFDEKTLVKEASLLLKKGEKAFVLGPNGCGKTSLFNVIQGNHKPVSGKIKIGENVSVGSYSQNNEGIDPFKTVMDEIWDAYPNLTQTQVRNALAAFLFKEDAVFAPIATLSGGERARVALLKLMLSRANLLLLDEPTNHLDISSREALEKALEDYTGTMLVISHDRYFINKLARRILAVEEGRLATYSGNYNYYLEKRAVPQNSAQQKIQEPIKNNSYKERKERQAQIRSLRGRIEKAERRIEELDREIAGCDRELCDPVIAADYVKTLKIHETQNLLKEELNELYPSWDDLSVQLTKLCEDD